MDTIFLDANIIMELFFNRARRSQVLHYMKQQEDSVKYVISILSADILFYHVEGKHLDKPSAHVFLSQYGIFDMNETDYIWAKSNDQNDFEDALQVACATRHGCQKFLTLDQGLKKRHQKHLSITLVR